MTSEFYDKIARGAYFGQSVRWSPGMTLEDVEKIVIINALRHFGGNQVKTAKALGIATNTLHAKVDGYLKDLTEQEKRNEDRRKREEEFGLRSRGKIPGNRPFKTNEPSTPTPVREHRENPYQLSGYNQAGERPPLTKYNPQAPAKVEQPQKHSNTADGGLRVESSSQPAPQPSVSVHERKEVQKVLPNQSPKSGQGGRR